MVRIARALTVATAALALSMSGLAAFPNEAHAANSGGEQLVYRLYNRVSSEHLYTTDANEVDVLKRGDWNYEGVAWVAPKKSDSPVWRLYSPGLGDHHYTKDANEVAALTSKYGWTNEGKKWYSDDLKTTPIYRQYNSRLRVGQHHYTADYNEYTVNNARNGWKGEGIAWHALKPGWAAGAKRVSAAAPTITDRSGEASDTVTIPNSSTVIYYLNGKKVSAGTYPITNYVKGADNWRRASVEIIARSVFGYDLNGVYKWNQIVIGNNVAPKPTPKPTTPAPTPTSAKPTSAKPSTPSAAPTSAKPTTPAKKNVKVVKPTFTQKDGKADTITIPNVTGVQYTIKGDKKTQAVKPGTY
ncbi:MAG: hypothetical protein IKS49_02215, partial [Actinomycetaceae bacterium]|nr:hypothetical protein [Actinomycetaceae bacterium]